MDAPIDSKVGDGDRSGMVRDRAVGTQTEAFVMKRIKFLAGPVIVWALLTTWLAWGATDLRTVFFAVLVGCGGAGGVISAQLRAQKENDHGCDRR